MKRNYDFDSDKAFLKIKMSEYQMLTDTLIEMMERGTSEIGIDEMKGAINETLDDINTLLNKIDKDEKVEYSFYDGITKPKLAKSVKLASFVKDKSSDGSVLTYETLKKGVEDLNEQLKKGCKNMGEVTHKTENLYDSIKKDFKPYDTPYNTLNYGNLYDTIKKEKPKFDGTKDENTTLKFLNTETNGKYVSDIITNANRFLVRFNGGLNISEWLVKSVDFAPTDRNELYITIQDHIVTSSEGKKYPIISQIRSKVNSIYELAFLISIDYLDRTGCTIYSERYHGCKIKDVIRSSVSYEVDDFNTISFTVTYTDVTYETSH